MWCSDRLFRGSPREIFQHPNDDHPDQDYRADLPEVMSALVPHVEKDVFQGRHPVSREFHDKGDLLVAEKQPVEDLGGQKGQDDPEGINADEDQGLMTVKMQR